jgi:uncharacterized protein with HEPN domain
MSRNPRLFLVDIADSARKVMAYTNGMSQEEFEANEMAYDAVLRNLEVIGEAAKRIPPGIRAQAPDIPWRMICGFRDHIAHGYFCLDNDAVWEVITEELPILAGEIGQLSGILGPPDGAESS